MNGLRQSSFVLFLSLSGALNAAEQNHATVSVAGDQPVQIELDQPACGATLELDRRHLVASIQIDSPTTDVRFVYEVDYAARDPENSLSIVVNGIEHFPISPGDLLIMKAEQAEQGKGNLSTTEIDALYDQAAELEDKPDPAFEQMLFTIGAVTVGEPWVGDAKSPVTNEQVELKLGPVQTMPDGQADTVVPVTFSYSGDCKIVRST
ncbi:MAG: hypothetical protein AB8C46_10040 [Burkholderiaceae bacterium]